MLIILDFKLENGKNPGIPGSTKWEPGDDGLLSSCSFSPNEQKKGVFLLFDRAGSKSIE
jgi:hypothetical protein